MLSAQSVLLNFLRSILVGIIATIGFFLLLLINKYLGNLSETILLLIQGGSVILLVWLVNLLDSYLRYWLSKEDHPKVGRVAYQLTISHVLTAAFFLPFLLVYANLAEQEANFWLFLLIYSITNILITQVWQLIYSQNEVKNISVYGIFGVLGALAAALIINPGLVQDATPLTLAIIIAVWFLAEFLIETILGLFYYGLHSFYSVSFWHHLRPAKVAPAEEEPVPEPTISEEPTSDQPPAGQDPEGK